jgi:hypothetical protein
VISKQASTCFYLQVLVFKPQNKLIDAIIPGTNPQNMRMPGKLFKVNSKPFESAANARKIDVMLKPQRILVCKQTFVQSLVLPVFFLNLLDE